MAEASKDQLRNAYAHGFRSGARGEKCDPKHLTNRPDPSPTGTVPAWKMGHRAGAAWREEHQPKSDPFAMSNPERPVVPIPDFDEVGLGDPDAKPKSKRASKPDEPDLYEPTRSAPDPEAAEDAAVDAALGAQTKAAAGRRGRTAKA